MTITIDTTPWDFLFNRSWECDSLKDFIEEHNISKEDFNVVVEDICCNSDEPMSETGLNDMLRFDWESICEHFSWEEEDEDESIEEDEERDA